MRRAARGLHTARDLARAWATLVPSLLRHCSLTSLTGYIKYLYYFYDIEETNEPADLVMLAPNLGNLGISQEEAMEEAAEKFEEYCPREKWRRELNWKSLITY